MTTEFDQLRAFLKEMYQFTVLISAADFMRGAQW